VRKLLTVTLASSAVVAIACGKSKAPTSTAMSADLKRDLQLAQATQTMRINPDEVSPQSQQQLALRPKKAPNGPKVIRTEHPTVRASAVPAEAAEIKTDMPQVQVAASSPTPSETPTPDAPPMARPAPVPAASYPSAGTIPAANTSGSGGILGGIFGAILRGGVGDDDHCDPHPRSHPAGHPIGDDGVYRRPGSFPGGRPVYGGAGRSFP
jgi:hypothetical protein